VRRDHRTTVIRVVAVAVLVVLARSLTGGGGSGGRSHTAPPPPPLPAASVGERTHRETPSNASQRILAEYARFPSLAAPDAEAALRDMASRASADGLVATLHADLTRLAAGYPGGTTRVWVGPLAARQSAVNESRAKVEIWFCRVVAPPGRPAYAEWPVGRFDLVWERDAWRLDGFDEVLGPRPAALPGETGTAPEIASALEGFSPAWPSS
jgi:hypothetical protein